MPYTQQQLQAILNSTTTDLNNLHTVINGDALTTVTMSDGTIVPSVRKIAQDAVTGLVAGLTSSYVVSLSKALQTILNEMYPTETYQIIYNSSNAGTLVQITLLNLVGVKSFTINGLSQPNDGSVYSISGSVLTIPANDSIQQGDVVLITYYEST